MADILEGISKLSEHIRICRLIPATEESTKYTVALSNEPGCIGTCVYQISKDAEATF